MTQGAHLLSLFIMALLYGSFAFILAYWIRSSLLFAIVCLLLFFPIFIICHAMAVRLMRVIRRSRGGKEPKDSSTLEEEQEGNES